MVERAEEWLVAWAPIPEAGTKLARTWQLLNLAFDQIELSAASRQGRPTTSRNNQATPRKDYTSSGWYVDRCTPENLKLSGCELAAREGLAMGDGTVAVEGDGFEQVATRPPSGVTGDGTPGAAVRRSLIGARPGSPLSLDVVTLDTARN